MRKILFVLLGVVALTFSVLGIVLPVLPTTPLLLLALYCFTKGSEKLSARFQETQIFKKYLAKYVRTKSLSLKQKIFIQILTGGMIIISFVLLENWILRIVLVGCFIIHNGVIIFKIKTHPPRKN